MSVNSLGSKELVGGLFSLCLGKFSQLKPFRSALLVGAVAAAILGVLSGCGVALQHSLPWQIGLISLSAGFGVGLGGVGGAFFLEACKIREQQRIFDALDCFPVRVSEEMGSLWPKENNFLGKKKWVENTQSA